jgi:hypothetical protein
MGAGHLSGACHPSLLPYGMLYICPSSCLKYKFNLSLAQCRMLHTMPSTKLAALA